jgi:hypothetical protein
MTAVDNGSSTAIPGAVDRYLFEGKVRLIGFGKFYPNPKGVLEKQDWSLRPFNNQEEAAQQTGHSITRYLPKIARDFGLGKMLYAPSPRLFNAQVCSESDTMKKRIMVTSPDYHNTEWLLRGADADGMLLSRGHTYMVSPAGCPVLIVWDEATSTLGVAHAGMRSLINEDALKGNPEARRSESVVYNLLDAMGCTTKRQCRALRAAIVFPIDPALLTYSWDHPDYGPLNKKRSVYVAGYYGELCAPGFNDPVQCTLGRINVEMIIRLQLYARGVHPRGVLTIPSPPSAVWRSTRDPGEDPNARNGVWVQHL